MEISGTIITGDKMVDFKEGSGKKNRSRTGPQMGEVFKAFGHEDANYLDPGSPSFDGTHNRCRSCAHWDDHGNCHIVPNVNPDGYCEEYYADVGAFGHKHVGYIEENLILIGDKFDFSMTDVKEFANDIRERLQSMVR